MKIILKTLIIFAIFFTFAFSENGTQKTDANQTTAEQQINEQNKKFEAIVDRINNEDSFKNSTKELEKEISFLNNRISINEMHGNSLAAKRDELKIRTLKNKLLYEKTLRDIVLGKKEYRHKEYFEGILKVAIGNIENNSVKAYTELYKGQKNDTSSVSSEFKKNYLELKEQRFNQLFILNKLLEDISAFRKTSFLMDELSIQYFIDKIDKLEGVDAVSFLTNRYFKFTIGELVLVALVFLVFGILKKYIVFLVSKIFVNILVRDTREDGKLLKNSMKERLKTPFTLMWYFFALHLSFLILIDNIDLLNKITPWWNTFFMGLLSWVVYVVLDSGIDIYASSFLQKYPNVRKEIIVFVLKIVRIVLILFVIMFLLTQLGIDIKAIAASLGVGGIAIALASKDTLENFFGSLTIMTDNSFSQGDWIKTKDVEGTVVDIRMRTTRIRTFDNSMITIPNSHLANTHIQNWSKRIIGRRIKMDVGITYESGMKNIKKLKDNIHEMLLTHPGIATEKTAVLKSSSKKRFEAAAKEDLQGVKRTLLVFIDKYSGSSVDIMIYCFSRSPNWETWLEVKEDVLMKIADLVDKNGCEFAYPTETLWLKNDDKISVKMD